MKKYCTQCGAATDFSFVKPKFCSSCGSNFDKPNFESISKLNQIEILPEKTKNPSPFRKSINTNPKNIEDHNDYPDYGDDDGIDVKSVPNINNLTYEYQSDKKHGLKFKDLISNPNNPDASPKRERTKKKKISKKDVENILQEFKNEAKAIRSKR